MYSDYYSLDSLKVGCGCYLSFDVADPLCYSLCRGTVLDMSATVHD